MKLSGGRAQEVIIMPKFEEFEKRVEEDNKRYAFQVHEMLSEEEQLSYNTTNMASFSGYEGTEVIAQLDERFKDQSTFEERTRYYFKANEMTEAKKIRYTNISKDKNAAKEMHDNYGTHSAYKRRKAAGKAADKFDKANKLASQFFEDNKTPMQIYNHREEMMKLRLEGRLAATEAKAKSPEHEKYLKAKAKLSTLMVLKEQIVHLKEKSTDKKMLDQFNEKEKLLDQELQAAKINIEQVSPSAMLLWQKLQKDGEYDCSGKTFTKRLKNSKKINANFGEKEGVLLTSLQYMHMQKVQWPQRLILENNKRPLNKRELKKEAWNRNYKEVLSEERQYNKSKTGNGPKYYGTKSEVQVQEEKKNYMIEAMNRVLDFKIPSKEVMYNTKDFFNVFNNNLPEYYEMLYVALPHLESKLGSKENSFEKDYIEDHKEFNKKISDLKTLKHRVDVMLKSHGIYDTKMMKYKGLPDGDIGFWIVPHKTTSKTKKTKS